MRAGDMSAARHSKIRRVGLALGVVAVVSAAFLVGRWTAPSSPASPAPADLAGEALWRNLAARPFHAPSMGADGLCPASVHQALAMGRFTNFASTSTSGIDPIWIMSDNMPINMSDMSYFSLSRTGLFVAPSYHGQMLVRARRIDSGAGPVTFAAPLELLDPGTPSSIGRPAIPREIDNGPHAGTATVDGRLTATWTELRLPAGDGLPVHNPTEAPQLGGEGWRFFSWLQIPLTSACYAFQADAPNFSRVVVVDYVRS
jgi:hypothetical protein